MKHFLFSILIILTAIQLSYSQSFKPVDFEAGGYVTEVYQTGILNTQTLFARTDIGGVYFSKYSYATRRWIDWTFLNTFATSPAGLHVQGFLVYYAPTSIYYFVCCGTDYLNGDPNQGLWRYDWGFEKWDPEPKLNINYGGNVPHSKIGGECIIWGNDNFIYTGGRTVNNQNGARSTVFCSSDHGDTWTDINPPEQAVEVKGHVSSIIMNPSNPDNVWIGVIECIGQKQHICLTLSINNLFSA